MTEADEPRLFTIGEVVAELQATYPDVSHSSLRFLERERLVEPVRTTGGHRLYRQSDVERVRTIKDMQRERLSLKDVRIRLEQMDALPQPDELGRRFLDRALKGEYAAAAHEILVADDVGMPLPVTFADVLQPALYEVGRRWAEGTLSVGQEHEITELARDVIAELTLRHARPRTDGTSVVAASVADELHDLGLRMVCGVLRQRGLRVHFLGANVSPAFLIDAVQDRRPDVVLLSATLDVHRSSIQAAVDALRRAGWTGSPPRIIAGGQWTQVGDASTSGVDVIIPPDASLERTVQQILSPFS